MRSKIGQFRFDHFFDREGLIRGVDDMDRQYQSRAGGLTRKIAQQSQRRSKRSADPGSPPRSHSGQLRKLLYYARVPSENSTIVGPAYLSTKLSYSVPEKLEHGGRARIPDGKGGERTVTYRAFPFMFPALRKGAPQFAGFWRDQLRRHYRVRMSFR